MNVKSNPAITVGKQYGSMVLYLIVWFAAFETATWAYAKYSPIVKSKVRRTYRAGKVKVRNHLAS